MELPTLSKQEVEARVVLGVCEGWGQSLRRQLGGKLLPELPMGTAWREAGLEKVQGQCSGCPSDLKKGREGEDFQACWAFSTHSLPYLLLDPGAQGP